MRPENYPSAQSFAVARAMRNVGNPHQQLANVARPAVKYVRAKIVQGGWYVSGAPAVVGDFVTLDDHDFRNAIALGRVEPV